MTVGHQVLQAGTVVVDEEHDIVYRDAAGAPTTTQPAAAQPAAAQGSEARGSEARGSEGRGSEGRGAEVPAGEGEREIGISPVVLFRFSALTYNAHRIHYDRDYCRDVEGYPGLLTHGPLQALAMAEAARARAGGCTGDVSFSYRLVAPLFDDQGLFVSAAKGPDGTTVTAVRDRYGRQTATGALGALAA